MALLRDLPLLASAVRESATFAEAARELVAAGVAALAVVDDAGAVVGLFTEDDLVGGLFPAYLGELDHSAFTPDDEAAFARAAREVADEPVRRHMREPVVLPADTSVAHAAERFLHCQWGALPVVDGERFVGMLSQLEFARAMAARLLADER